MRLRSVAASVSYKLQGYTVNTASIQAYSQTYFPFAMTICLVGEHVSIVDKFSDYKRNNDVLGQAQAVREINYAREFSNGDFSKAEAESSKRLLTC